MSNAKTYYYCGPVKQFGNIISKRMELITYAESVKKAKTNFMHQAKRKLGLATSAKIEIDEAKIKF